MKEIILVLEVYFVKGIIKVYVILMIYMMELNILVYLKEIFLKKTVFLVNILKQNFINLFIQIIILK